MEAPTVYFVMGICGSGKSTVAKRVADSLGIQMLDSDDFHPPENVAKMRSGVPLTDEDRAGWLQRLNSVLRERVESGSSVVIAVSALKQRYREVLQNGVGDYRWIYLRGDRDLIHSRMALRSDHFMPPALIDSQLETLEEPSDALVVDISPPLPELVSGLLERLRH